MARVSGTRKNKDKPSRPGRPGTGGSAGGFNDHPVPAKGNEWDDDNVTRMPVDGSLVGVRAAQRLARQLQQRGGRGSTRLTNTAGTASYVASLMGSTQ